MAVYVDNANERFAGMVMCHLVADTPEELRAMAERIGLARKWIQHPGTAHEHFDVCQAKRRLAVAFGAVEITRLQLANWLYQRGAQVPCQPSLLGESKL
jgi:hypothetical protein